MALVTDYDCWRECDGSESVTIEMVIKNLLKNVEAAKGILKSAVRMIGTERSCGCACALKDAIVTDPKKIPLKKKKELALLIGKYLR